MVNIEELFFFSDAFEWFVIGLLVDELAGVYISFCPPVILGVIGLGTLSDSAFSVAIAGWRIGCHDVYSLFMPISMKRKNVAAGRAGSPATTF